MKLMTRNLLVLAAASYLMKLRVISSLVLLVVLSTPIKAVNQQEGGCEKVGWKHYSGTATAAGGIPQPATIEIQAWFCEKRGYHADVCVRLSDGKEYCYSNVSFDRYRGPYEDEYNGPGFTSDGNPHVEGEFQFTDCCGTATFSGQRDGWRYR